jgi:BirA family transcriptional regulator, biotin operon repressor / biotin---[acetyl-CoA-carboxylase] ligase
MTQFIARSERFDLVGSTNDVVRGWLADGTPEVCLAVADEQSAGRGRDGRTWSAPAGVALLLSVGFRPSWLPPAQLWRLAASVSMAMAEAGESVAGLADGSIRLKWPNDLVVDAGAGVRKLAGVLGESTGIGTDDPRAVIGIGVNGDWPAEEFPADFAGTMTSLRALTSDAPIDHAALLDAFLGRLEGRIVALREGRFDVDAWADRQVTTGRDVVLIAPDGDASTVRALGVDAPTGALVVADPTVDGGRRIVVVGEIRHIRLPATAAASPPATQARV